MCQLHNMTSGSKLQNYRHMNGVRIPEKKMRVQFRLSAFLDAEPTP